MNNDALMLDVAIVGGGILGCLMAYEISDRFPDLTIAVFEKEKFLGDHTTGRNSGVMHAGIYYPNGSHKHRFCLEGNTLWDKLSRDLGVSLKRCGKFVVATQVRELDDLERIFKQAKKNNVPQLRSVSASEKHELEQVVHVKDAFWSGSTGILDVAGALEALQRELYKKNVPVLKQNLARDFRRESDGFYFQVNGEEIGAKVFINVAGLWAVDLRKQLGLSDLENEWVKGNYLRYGGKVPTASLIYPVPPLHQKGLGVHLTFNHAEEIYFGPNTEDVSSLNYAPSTRARADMLPAIASLFKNIQEDKLTDAYAGIRPKIKKDGKLFTDFWLGDPQVHGIPNYYEFCGIESPGLTAAPALAKWLGERLAKL